MMLVDTAWIQTFDLLPLKMGHPGLFKNIWTNPGLFFVYFRPFHTTNQLQIEISIDGVLGIRTWGRRMVGTDETTELLRPPILASLFVAYIEAITK